MCTASRLLRCVYFRFAHEAPVARVCATCWQPHAVCCAANIAATYTLLVRALFFLR